MSQFTPIQRTFLTNVLSVTVTPRTGISKLKPKRFRSDEENLATDLVNSFEDYQKEESKILEEVKEVGNQLKDPKYKAIPGVANLAKDLVKELQGAQQIAKAGKKEDKQQALAQFKQAAGLLDKIKKDTRQVLDTLDDYLGGMKEATDLRDKLSTENRHPHPPFDKPLRDLVNEAVTLATAAKHAEAVAKLGTAKSLYDQGQKAVQLAHDQDVGRAKYEPIYKELRKRAVEGLAELRDLPGAKSDHDAIKQKVDTADTAAQQNRYEDAYHELKGIEKDVKKAHKNAQSYHDKAGNKDYRKVLEEAEEAYKTLAGLIEMSDPQTLESFRKTIDDTLRALDGVKSKDETTITPQINALKHCIQQMQVETNKMKDKADEARNLYNELDKSVLTDLSALMPTADFAPWGSRVWSARTLMGAGQYQQAIDELEQIKKDVKKTQTKYQDKAKKWEDLVKDYETNHKALVTKGQSHTFFPDVQTAANAVDSALQTSVLRVKETHDYDEIHKVFQQTLKDKMPTITSGLDQFEKSKAAFDELKQAYNDGAKEVREKIQELQKKEGDTEPFTKALADEETEYTKTVNGLLGKPASAITPAKDTTVQRLKKIVTDIEAVLGDTRKLQQSKDSATTKQLQAKGQKLEREIQNALKILALSDPTKAKNYTQDLQNAGSNYDQAHITELEKVKTKAENANEENANKVKDIKEKATTQAKELKDLAGKLERGMPILHIGGHKDYHPYFESLKGEIQDALAMSESSVLEVAQAGKRKLDELKQKIERMQTENDSKDPNAKNYAAVDKGIKEIEKLLSSKDLKECKPTAQKVFEHRLKNEVRPKIYALSPEAALANTGPLKEFKKEIAAAIREAQKRTEQRKTLNEDGEKLLKELEELDKKSAFRKQLEDQIKGAMKPGEDKEETAILNMKNYERQISQAKDPQNLLILEQVAHQREFEAEKQKAAWEANKKIYEETTKKDLEEAYNEAEKKTRDGARYKEAGQLYKEALKHAKKENYLAANQTIEEATSAALTFIASPQGDNFTARGKLPKIYKGWQQAVSAFLANISALKKKITEVAATDPSVDPKNAIAALDLAARSFDARMFDQTIKDITDKDATLTKIRVAKENGLRYLRQYRNVLDTDPVIEHLRENPFTQFTTVMLEDKIRDFELSLLRS